RASVRRVSAVRQPALRSALRRWTTQLTYCPWFRQGVTEPSGSILPAHGQCSDRAEGTSVGQVMGSGFPFAVATPGRSSSAERATIRVEWRMATSFGGRSRCQVHAIPAGSRNAAHPSREPVTKGRGGGRLLTWGDEFYLPRVNAPA